MPMHQGGVAVGDHLVLERLELIPRRGNGVALGVPGDLRVEDKPLQVDAMEDAVDLAVGGGPDVLPAGPVVRVDRRDDVGRQREKLALRRVVLHPARLREHGDIRRVASLDLHVQLLLEGLVAVVDDLHARGVLKGLHGIRESGGLRVDERTADRHRLPAEIRRGGCRRCTSGWRRRGCAAARGQHHGQGGGGNNESIAHPLLHPAGPAIADSVGRWNRFHNPC